ncbi:MAG: nuclear transport factor 2 family protein [Acidobacteria bacterium]|nr:nuclear transport factor 2 family protein [Acidobacteriota bacterium]
MKKVTAVSFLLALLVAGSAFADATQNVLALERAACAAYERNDAAAIEKLVDERYTLTDSKGVITTRADDVKAARDRDVEYTEFRNYDMKVRLYNGDTAIVTGRTVVKGTTRDGSKVNVEVQFTDTVVRIDGRWRLVAGHVSRLRNS